ncbi:LuxR C-terminal-related transcriptional regulator [Streptomyces sp. NPDC020681]|uniref:helix-turn-helix transcriptional regulator n=1 Tax=Streptomyces sp. NPDC020681 TaxID=3365083 RepID=UPI0037B25C67
MTPEQIKIIAGLARGHTRHTIAQELDLSVHTVRWELVRAARAARIDATDRHAALVDYAYRKRLLTRLTPEPRPPVTLTARRFEFLCWLASGATNAEIGEQLGVSIETVKTTVRSMYHRLGAKTRAHAIALAWQQGLLAPGHERAGV